MKTSQEVADKYLKTFIDFNFRHIILIATFKYYYSSLAIKTSFFPSQRDNWCN